MKAFCGKFETLSDQSIKLSIYCPRELKREAIELSDEEVNVVKFSEDTVTISKSEYEALTQGGHFIIPSEKKDALKNIASMLLDWCEG